MPKLYDEVKMDARTMLAWLNSRPSLVTYAQGYHGSTGQWGFYIKGTWHPATNLQSAIRRAAAHNP